MKKLELMDSWPLRGRALDCKSCSAQVVYSGTQDISLAVDFATLVMDKAQFLLECSTMIAPAMWVGVKPGSIVFDCGRRNAGDPRRCSDHDDISGTEPAKFRQHPENPNSRAHLQLSTSPTTASPPSAKGTDRSTSSHLLPSPATASATLSGFERLIQQRRSPTLRLCLLGGQAGMALGAGFPLKFWIQPF